MSLFCEHSSLVTESDVEQKFLYPFLTEKAPMGLSLENSEILTKSRLRILPCGMRITSDSISN